LPDGSNVPTPPPSGNDEIIYGDGSTQTDHTVSGNENNNTILFNDAWLADDFKIVDGKGGVDTLSAVLRLGSVVHDITTKSVEKVRVQAEQRIDDGKIASGDNNIVDGAQIDAEKFFGVNVWESYKSRADVVVEDITIYDKAQPIPAGDATLKRVTADVTFEFRDSDPGHVDFAAYFNPHSLVSGEGGKSGGSLTLWVDNLDPSKAELEDAWFERVEFSLDGHAINLDVSKLQGASTYAELGSKLQDALKSYAPDASLGIPDTVVAQVRTLQTKVLDLAKTTAVDGKSTLEAHPILISFPDGATAGVLGKGRISVSSQDIAGDTLFGTKYETVDPHDFGALVTSKVVLDNVGSGSTSGYLVIGSLSTGYTSTSRGVQQFDIKVQRDSRLEVISSTNNSLEVVNIESDGQWVNPGSYLSDYNDDGSVDARYGLLTVLGHTNNYPVINTYTQSKANAALGHYDWHTDASGRALWRTKDDTAEKGAPQPVDGSVEQGGFGLADIRVLNASKFQGNLTLSTSLTDAVQDKYLNQRDNAPQASGADNIYFTPDRSHFQYVLGQTSNVFDLAISNGNLQGQADPGKNGGGTGVGTREDVKITISGTGSSRDVVNTLVQDSFAIDEDTGQATGAAAEATLETNWFLNTWKNTHEYNRVNKYKELVYDAGKKDSGLHVNTGAGDDTVSNLGAGAWDVFLGTGNDTYYSGNLGDRAVWVFNTRNQRLLDGTADRDINDLRSDEDNVYAFKGTLDVRLTLPNQIGDGIASNLLFNDVNDERPDYVSLKVAIPETADGLITDLQINQAIKKAINSDPVLSKLLEAVDGPANTLVVRSLIDGVALDAFDPGTGVGGGYKSAGYSGLTVSFYADPGYTPTADQLAAANGKTGSDLVAKGDYTSALAGHWVDTNNDGTLDTYFDLAGSRDGGHITSNRVHIENGQDVVVFSTNKDSQDVLVFDAFDYASGSKTTVVHFSTDDATNSNRGNQLQKDKPIYQSGRPETFEVRFTKDLELINSNPSTKAQIAILGGRSIVLDGTVSGGGADFPSTTPRGIVDAFFEAFGDAPYLGAQPGGGQLIGYTGTSLGNPGYYWYQTTSGGVTRYWQVESNAAGDGLIFTQIETDSIGSHKETPVYKNENVRFTDPEDATKLVEAPVSGENEHFRWTNLKPSNSLDPESYTNPTSVVAKQDGQDNGHEASAAKIVVDYYGSSIAYDGFFWFGKPNDASGVKIEYKKGWNHSELTDAIVNAVNAANVGWTAKKEGSVVTYERTSTGSLDDPSTTSVDEWLAYYVGKDGNGDYVHLGEVTGSGTKGIALLPLADLNLSATSAGGNFTFLGLKVTIHDTADENDLGKAIVDAYELAVARGDTLSDVLKDLTGGVPGGLFFDYATGNSYYQGADVADATAYGVTPPGGGAKLVFKQTTAKEIDLATVLADTDLFKADPSLRPLGFDLALDDINTGTSTAYLTFEFDEAAHPGGVITYTPTGGAPTTAIISTGTTAASFASQFATLGTYVDSNGGNWTLSLAGGLFGPATVSLQYTSGGTPGPVGYAQLRADILGKIARTSDPIVTTDTGGTIELVDFVDGAGNDPSWFQEPVIGTNGINIYDSGPRVITFEDGKSQWLNQIGVEHPEYEVEGDADYLDFSAWDAYKVVEGSTTYAQTTDTAGTGNYISITGGSDGVYNFTLVEGSGGSKLLGIVDFGETVDFNGSNFILYNDIIV
jgi:hypothetical protein